MWMDLESVMHSEISQNQWTSEVAQSCPTLCNLMDYSLQAPPSMEFSRQEYWSGLPFPSPGDLSNPGIEPRSPELQADTLLSEPPGKPEKNKYHILMHVCGT